MLENVRTRSQAPELSTNCLKKSVEYFLSIRSDTIVKVSVQQIVQSSCVEALQIGHSKNTILETLRHAGLVFKARPEALLGAGVWLLPHSSYQAWIESSPSILWCYGAPGVGKSLLASVVIGDLRERKAREGCYVLYHFCNFASRQQETDMVILQDLLS